LQFGGLKFCLGGLGSEFWVRCDSVAPQLEDMESGWHCFRSWYRGNSEQRNIFM